MINFSEFGAAGGVLALAWMTIDKLIGLLGSKPEKDGLAGDQPIAYWELSIGRIFDEKLQDVFKDRDLHIRELIRQELEQHLHKGS